MTEKRFKSKVDTWIALLIAVVAAMDIAFIVFIAMSSESPADKTSVVLIMVGLFVFLMWLAFRTYYAVDKTTLRVVSGPMRWKIAIDEIKSVSPTRSLWSSPAMSLDRLLIVYGKGRRIMVSPAAQHGFLQALGHDDNCVHTRRWLPLWRCAV